MGYHHRQTDPYPQGNVQGGQPQDSGYNNQRTSRSQSLHATVQTGDHSTLNRSLSAGRTPVPGQTQPFDAYANATGQNREPGPQYVSSPNTPQYITAQGQGQSPSYQDPSHAYQSGEYFPLEGAPPHLVSQQSRTHQSQPQQPSVPHNPSHSVQGQYTPQYQRGDVDYPAGHLQQRRLSSTQYNQQQQQQQPSTQLYSQQSQPSQPQSYQQQPTTQPYSQHQQPSPVQERRQYQPSSQQYAQQQQQPSSRQYTQQQQPSSQQYTQQQQQPSSQQYAQQHQSLPLRQQGNLAATPAVAGSSFGANVPSEIYGEEIRQSRSTRRGTSPICRLLNCRNPAVREVATHELSEYCSLDHMQEDIRRGAQLCPACNKCPRRLDGGFCGGPCETWDMERLRQPRQQQQHYPRPQSGARPHLLTPSSSPGNVTWDAARSESSHVTNYGSGNQHLLPGGLVHCPRCNTTYSARGTSRSRYGGSVDVSLPPCPTCGFSQWT